MRNARKILFLLLFPMAVLNADAISLYAFQQSVAIIENSEDKAENQNKLLNTESDFSEEAIVSLFSLQIDIFTIGEKFVLHEPHFIIQYSPSFWQPPKIS